MQNPGTFEGQVVVVTGASRGLGRGCALAFAAQGAEVVLMARKHDELEALAVEIREAGGRATAMPCDVTDPDAVSLVFAALDRCDVLLNNAGGNRPQAFLEVDHETLDDLLALNVRSMFLTAQTAARLMARQRSGSIVHMSSQMGHVGAVDRTVYCMTKHAIEGLTKAMAVELAPQGIRVNAVAPTYIETALTRPFLSKESIREEIERRIPLGRVGTVEEVVGAVLFLASSAASLITGTSLLIDGGYTAQ
ncbi:MAG TPA: SDR family NAD(P)-dependent oxidoreductase [Steroidobacteraceae bacterium]|nr:SDR family NAD(P)-dependent oxidoreductase [Steroidobacteraceae bacterium]